MKLLVSLALLILSTVSSFAECSNCSDESRHTFYIQPIAKTSQIGSDYEYWLGLQAGLMVSDHFGIGAAFNSLESPHYSRLRLDEYPRGDQLSAAYAGLVLSYTGRIGKRWHAGLDLLLGDGWKGWEYSYPDYYGNWDPPQRTRFLALEPSVRMEADLARSLRLAGSVGYFRAQGLPDWISGVMCGVGLKYLVH